MIIKKVLLSTIVFCVWANQAYGSEDADSEAACAALLKPSAILLLRDKCDQRDVRVRGILRIGAEMSGLWDSLESIKHARFMTECITVYDPRGLVKAGSVRQVDIRGVFLSRRPERLLILGACTDAIVEVHQIEELDGRGGGVPPIANPRAQ